MRVHHLDGLRAIAIGLVTFHHFFTGAIRSALARHGHHAPGEALHAVTASGVELFFVLSGVVLARPYLREERSLDVAAYARRRVERLWPPYLLSWLVAGLVVLVATVRPSWYSIEILPAFDWRDWLRQLPIVNVGGRSYNAAWWSLGPELLFYAIVPLLVALVRRGGRGTIEALLAIGVVASVATWNETWSAPGFQASGGRVALQFVAYAPCFLLGVALARRTPSARLATAMIAAGAAWIVLACALPRANVHVGFAVAYAGVASLADHRARLRTLLSGPLLVWVGERSYSWFLVHVTMLSSADHVSALVFRDRGPAYFALSRSLGLALSAVGTVVVFAIGERRFARGLTTAWWRTPWSGGARPGA